MIVILSHIGTKLTHGKPGTEAGDHDGAPISDEDVAAAVPGIDVIISGHTHIQVDPPKVVGKTQIVSTGMGGAYLGKLRLELAGGAVRTVKNSLIPIDTGVPAQASIEAMIAPYRAPMLKTLDTVIGEATGVFDKYKPETPECGVNNLIADAMLAGARSVEELRGLRIQLEGTGH